MKLKITILFIAFISTFSIAQTKVGTVDSDYIISIMPETKIVVERAKAYGAKLDSSFSIKTKLYKEKIEDYRKKEKELGELMKKTMLTEIATLEQDIKQYQTNGNKLMQLKQSELMRPLYKLLGDAISKIAKENGYTQVFTITGNQFAYVDDKFDITDLVVASLGIKVPEVKE